MTNLNENQKKWGLTAVLVAVLGFSLSAPMQQGLQALDLASTAPGKCDPKTAKEEYVIDSKGNKHKVTYLKCEGDEVTAFIPVKLEGKSCETCLSQKTLKANFEDAKDLEAALRKSIASTATQTPDRPDDETRDDEKSRLANEALNRAADRCSSKKKDDSALASCLNREFLNVLRRNKIEPADAKIFFNANIKPVLRRLLRDYEDGNTSYQDVASMIKDLQSDLPAGYKDLRDQLKDLVSEAVKSYADKLRKDRVDAAITKATADQYDRQAQMSRDPSMRMMYQQMAMELRQTQMLQERKNMSESVWLQGSVIPTFLSQTRLGLLDAVSNRFVDQSYMDSTYNFLRMNTMQSMTYGNSQLNPQEYAIVPINNINGSPIPGANNIQPLNNLRGVTPNPQVLPNGQVINANNRGSRGTVTGAPIVNRVFNPNPTLLGNGSF